MSDPLTQIFAYHQATKHHFHAYARGPGQLDWATQPNPFRRYEGAPLIALHHIPPSSEPLYDAAFVVGRVLPHPFTHRQVSQLFVDGLALSAWKQAGDSSWALRINPSSGNLHPTEGYLVCGPIAGLCTIPMVCHYSPADHALERRAELPLETWLALTKGLPEPVILIGFTSVHWREAWKYGERAYRYCQHDVGHALAAVSLAAAALGWRKQPCWTTWAQTPWPLCWVSVIRKGPKPKRLIVCWRFIHRECPSSTALCRARCWRTL